MSKPVLQVIIASTRPGRIGLPIGTWFAGVARGQGDFEVELADLAEINLPFFDEPNHPRAKKYVHEHTKQWSERIARSDAFVVVTPEYNHGTPAPLKNAIDFLHHEWQNKPVGFVSYGGVSAGLRGVGQTKQVFAALRVLPAINAVSIPNVFAHMSEDGQTFVAAEGLDKVTVAMIEELRDMNEGLKALRG